MLCECSVICDLYILIISNFMGCVFQKFVPCVDFVENRQCPDLFFGLKPRVLIETLFWNTYSSGRF